MNLSHTSVPSEINRKADRDEWATGCADHIKMSSLEAICLAVCDSNIYSVV